MRDSGIDDLHHLEHAENADLILFMAGNQLMAMEEKRVAGTTIFTVVHHRETPLQIAKKTADVGPVWATEAVHATSGGLPCEEVEPGEEFDQRDKINYYVCKLTRAPNPESVQKFLDFICSPTCHQIYKDLGFLPHFGG